MPKTKPATPRGTDLKEDRSVPVSKSEAAKTSSAKSRINIPFNLKNWKSRTDEEVEMLSWFHQHLLENEMSYAEAKAAIGYDKSNIYRILHGTYEAASWKNIYNSIQSYRKLALERTMITHASFCENSTTKLICGGLSYALQNSSITTIIGESRRGKTVTTRYWRDQNNHGRTVLGTAPTYGGPKALLREIAYCLGINRNTSIVQMHESILRAFNPNRMLILDEAHRLLPGDRRSNPVMLEIVRDIHDRTGCGLGIIATERFSEELTKSEYQFEQLLGRIGMPVRIPKEVPADDIEPMIAQFLDNPTRELNAELLRIANSRGSLGILHETLKVASKMANKSKQKLTSATVLKAIKLRRHMMGETQYARKK